MANGRVITGFSKPWVAVYGNSGTTVTYTGVTPLARGVDVDVQPAEPGDNKFYADNLLAETDASVFTSGTVTINVDGLKDAAEKLVYGLPTADEAGWTHYGASQTIPFIGFGFVIRYQENNVESFVPVVLRKVQLNAMGTTAKTAGEQIEFQTQQITGKVYRDDSANSEWKWRGEAKTTEAAAEDLIKTALGYVPSP